MKKLFIITIIAAAGLGTTHLALADEKGSCHFHGSTAAKPETVTSCAFQRKEKLIKQGKIDPSWQSVSEDTIEQVDGKKGKEWMVTFQAATATDKKKETLYMFFTLTGNFIAANHTGR